MTRSKKSIPKSISNQKSISNIPPPQPTKPKESGGFMSNVAQGFSVGLGQSIAHRTISGLFNYPNNNNNTHYYEVYDKKIFDPDYIPDPGCKILYKEFMDCIQQKTNSNQNCSSDYQNYKGCESFELYSKK